MIPPTFVTNISHRQSHYFSQPTLLIALLTHLSHTTSFPIVLPLSFLSLSSFVCHHCHATQGLCVVPALNHSHYIVVAYCLYSSDFVNSKIPSSQLLFSPSVISLNFSELTLASPPVPFCISNPLTSISYLARCHGWCVNLLLVNQRNSVWVCFGWGV